MLLSVFGDASTGERFSLIAILLAIYLVLGAVWGYVVPQYSWRWGLVLKFSWGLAVGALFAGGAQSVLCPHAAALVALPSLGALGASRARSKKAREELIDHDGKRSDCLFLLGG